MARSPAARALCFTIFDESLTFSDILAMLKKVKPQQLQYSIAGAEICPTTWRYHWQGYAIFDRKIATTSLGKHLNGAHCIVADGSAEDNQKYCGKHGMFEEWGMVPPDLGQGARSDLAKAADEVVKGKRFRDMAPTDIARFSKGLMTLRSLNKPPENGKKREIFLYYGPPRTGKSTCVRRKYTSDLYFKPLGKDFWFDGYDLHKVVVLDDFSGEIPLKDLLSILDNYVVQVPVKGGFTWFNPETVIVISNLLPNKWYDYRGREILFEALIERLRGGVFVFEKNIVSIKPLEGAEEDKILSSFINYIDPYDATSREPRIY